LDAELAGLSAQTSSSRIAMMGRAKSSRSMVGGNPAEGEVPAELLNDVKSAAEGCPAQAITVEE